MIGTDLDVLTSAGIVRGAAQAGIAVFLGLPFAAPPVGQLRFRSPQPVAPWSGVRDATQPGSAAPQVLTGGSAWIYENDGDPDEDCLSLNVWTPGRAGGRPVMVWFHGGAFQTGHAALPCFNGTRLARDGDVVVVTCNYRLGGLGWLAHPDLADPATGTWANWGLQDHRAALRWVRDNIAAFGGDPGNVTLFGESAGGMTIAHLARDRANAGLYHRLIAQSPPRRFGYAATPDLAAAYAEAVAAALGVAVADLRTPPADRLQETARQVGRDPAWATHNVGAHPVADGLVIPDEAAAVTPPVPLLVGSTRNESAMWFTLRNPDGTRASSQPPLREAQIPALLAALLAAYPAARLDPAAIRAAYRAALPGASEIARFLELWTDGVFRAPVAAWAAAQTARGFPAYVYEFAHPSPIAGVGSAHTLEIPFVFGTFDGPFLAPKAGAGPIEADLSARMRTIWTTFARTGDPATTLTGDWPPYDPARRSVMVLGGPAGQAHLVAAPREATRAVWEAAFATNGVPSVDGER